MTIMYSLLLLSSLPHITTCTAYTVIPDDHHYPSTTCHHCHNLQHYLLNITKYFTTNTQLLFLPGLHHLHNDLIIQNVHNISLIGSTANGTTLKATIQGNLSAILMQNIFKLTIGDLIISISCDNTKILYCPEWIIPLTFKDCSFVSLHHLQVYQIASKLTSNVYALKATNMMGSSNFSHVICYHGSIKLFYNEAHIDREQPTIIINHCMVKGIYINMLQKSYTVKLKVIHMLVQHNVYQYNLGFLNAEKIGRNKILIVDCQFVSNTYFNYLFSVSNGTVQFIDCQFINNSVSLEPFGYPQPILIKMHRSIDVEFINCNFHDNGENILQISGQSTLANIIIKNTNYSATASIHYESLISLLHATLTIKDSVNFYNITGFTSIIDLEESSTIIISGTVKFLYLNVDILIDFHKNYKHLHYIIIKENSILNISHNTVQGFFYTGQYKIYPQPYCIFQYLTQLTSKAKLNKKNFQITFYDNTCSVWNLILYYMPTSSCSWTQNSSYQNLLPPEVNDYYIQYIDTTGTCEKTKQSSLCVCANKLHYDCHANDLGYLYSGQTLDIFLHSYKADSVAVKTDITQQFATPCIVLNVTENLQSIEHCTKLHYTIGFPTDNWCELFLKIASDSDDNLTIFYIRQIACPTGFAKIDKRCHCDPVLVQYGITNCNINDQTILCRVNSWISATTHNNSYTYHISLHCPFHYCLPHSSHLNFSTPNSQCQFNRSGLLCGHCQQDLSAVFSSFHCQHCSNIYLLLIIPIAITGVVLVILLFVLNLTVTDGTINGFILYANIISINTPVFFAKLNQFTPAYTFISLANLDLGIQTCFYNGMDDYAKMWLQLAFPFYLIFIATLIIITSRYSITIQRLTARRALPVLATLFLLSYTEILRIVSSVLFFYSTITHLPSKHTTLVWSVDANVPLFGVRFTILFIVCLILFLILVPFNVILLFTRTLSRLRFINKFKPLLDAYQGPYKDKYYYWTGLQLLIRAVFFGISSLDRNINLTISIILLGILGGIHGIIQPFKMMYKNYLELVLLLNLQSLYAILSSYQDGNNLTIVTIMLSMAAIQFTFIITYHMITYVCGGVIRNKIQLSINTFTGWITRLHKKSQPQHFQLEDNIRENIPEVAFKYHEFREPLLDQD